MLPKFAKTDENRFLGRHTYTTRKMLNEDFGTFSLFLIFVRIVTKFVKYIVSELTVSRFTLTAYRSTMLKRLAAPYESSTTTRAGCWWGCRAIIVPGIFARTQVDNIPVIVRKLVLSLLRRERGCSNSTLAILVEKVDGPFQRAWEAL